MTRRHYGALYLVAPGQPDDPDRWHERVTDTYDDRGYERDNRTLTAPDVDELLALLDGLEDALARTITDENLSLRDEHLARVRQRARLIDVDEVRGSLASYAVLEGNSRVSALRHILRTARERSAHVALD